FEGVSGRPALGLCPVSNDQPAARNPTISRPPISLVRQPPQLLTQPLHRLYQTLPSQLPHRPNHRLVPHLWTNITHLRGDHIGRHRIVPRFEHVENPVVDLRGFVPFRIRLSTV